MERGLRADAPYLPTRDDDFETRMRGALLESRTPVRRRRSPVWLWLGAVWLVLGALYLANGYAAPLRFDNARIAGVAEVLARGGTWQMNDLAIDFKRLRRAQIAALEQAPGIVILGGSSWREVHQGAGWEHSVLNAFVPGMTRAGMSDLIEALEARGMMPGHVVLSIEPGTFQAESDGAPDWLARLSPVALVTGLAGGGETGASMQSSSRHEWVLLPDGSVVPPRASDPGRVEMLALSAAAQLSPEGIEIDTAEVEAMGALIAGLRAEGIAVTLAIPPVHPRFWDAVDDTPYRNGLDYLHETATALATDHGAVVIGGHDPAGLGCGANMFHNARLAGPDCLGSLIQGIAVGDGV